MSLQHPRAPTTSINMCSSSRPISWIFLMTITFISNYSSTNTIYTTVGASTTDLDDKSIAMATRIINKIKDDIQPDTSWNILLEVLEHTFLGITDSSKYNYQSSKNEETGRKQALHWLANIDTSSNTLSEKEYDAGLLQRYALATIYFTTNGDEWTTCSQLQSSPCESNDNRYLSSSSHLKWNGINGKNGLVTWLDLSNVNLQSSNFLPLELTLLQTNLEVLWISDNNQLSGSLPNYIGNEFTNLVSLSIYKTNMGGSIPDSIYNLIKLSSLRLYKSNFTGTISSDIEKLTELKWLWIHDNNFVGSVPDTIGKLVKLEGVTLHGNEFTPIVASSGSTESAQIEEGVVNIAEKKDEEKSDDATANEEKTELEKVLTGEVKEEANVYGNLKSNIIPEGLCHLKKIHLKHLWTDCEDDALVSTSLEGGKDGSTLVVQEGKQACSCCTRCFPRKKMMSTAIE